MKNSLSIPRIALAAFALGTASVTATFAQTTTNSPSTTGSTNAPTCTVGGWHHHNKANLTPAEWAQLKKDRASALASNPALQTQEAALKQQLETLKNEGQGVATKAQWDAFHQQKVAFKQQLHSAELLLDPSVKPVLDKLAAAHGKWHHHFENSSTNTPSST